MLIEDSEAESSMSVPLYSSPDVVGVRETELGAPINTHLHCSSMVAEDEMELPADRFPSPSSDSIAFAAGIKAMVAIRPGRAMLRADAPAKTLLFIAVFSLC